MSKKTITRTRKPLSPRPAVKQPDMIFLVREDRDEQLEHPGSSGAVRATAEPAPAPTPVPLEPLMPLAAVWPDAAAANAPKPVPAATPPSPKPSAQSVPTTSPEKSAASAQAPKPATAKAVNVSFSLFEPDAKQVSLCGDFNEWSPNATPMKWKEGGRWAATVALAPGRYQYKFVADGRWMHDPAARENVSTQHGTLNSVVEVRA